MQPPGSFLLYFLLSCGVLGFALFSPLFNLHIIVGVECFLGLLLVTLEDRIYLDFSYIVHDGLLHILLLIPKRLEYTDAILSALDLTGRCSPLHQIVCVLVKAPDHRGRVLLVLLLESMFGLSLGLLLAHDFGTLDHLFNRNFKIINL